MKGTKELIRLAVGIIDIQIYIDAISYLLKNTIH